MISRLSNTVNMQIWLKDIFMGNIARETAYVAFTNTQITTHISTSTFTV